LKFQNQITNDEEQNVLLERDFSVAFTVLIFLGTNQILTEMKNILWCSGW